MCGSNPSVSPAVNSAKCWAIPALVFAIISMVGFIGGAWVQGIGGIIVCIGSSILICCGPTSETEGAGKCMAAFVLMLIGGIIELLGAVLGLVFYFAVVGSARESCETSWGWLSEQSVQDCVNTTVGIMSILVFPSVAIGIVTGVLVIVGSVKAKQAHSSFSAAK